MRLRLPLGALSLALVACATSATLDDLDDDKSSNRDAGTGADGDTDSGTNSDGGTNPDDGPVACDPECDAGQRCQGGVCVCDAESCPTGCCTAEQGGSCVAGTTMEACGQGGALCEACDPKKADSCGASGCECNGGPACATGECMGNLGCVDLQTDPNNCGALGNDCLGGPCVNGNCQLVTVDISQMTNHTPGDEGISCGSSTTVGVNSWWRRFYFNEHSQVRTKARIVSVTVTTGDNAVSSGLPSRINLYTLPHSTPINTIPTGSLTLIGTATTTIFGSYSTATIPVTGLVDDTANKDLVVEWYTDGSSQGSFFPGGNSTYETHPTFVSSPECGVAQPTRAADLGFPEFHLPMIVTLETGAAGP